MMLSINLRPGQKRKASGNFGKKLAAQFKELTARVKDPLLAAAVVEPGHEIAAGRGVVGGRVVVVGAEIVGQVVGGVPGRLSQLGGCRVVVGEEQMRSGGDVVGDGQHGRRGHADDSTKSANSRAAGASARHCRTARAIAEEFFDARTVLRDLLESSLGAREPATPASP